MISTHILLAVVAGLIVASLASYHFNHKVEFNLLDLLMENGRVSKIACVFLGSFGLTSWIMLDLQVHGKMTEGYLTLYGGLWVAPLVTRVLSGKPHTEAKPQENNP